PQGQDLSLFRGILQQALRESLGNGIFTAAKESERAYFEPENFTGCQNNHFEVSYRVTNPLPKPY
ncbi:MAG: hypothetical protein OXH01_07790, partial [Bacteroidetes bacterium]|nr:hypothetical protein [Bacteroidota bacterium]